MGERHKTWNVSNFFTRWNEIHLNRPTKNVVCVVLWCRRKKCSARRWISLNFYDCIPRFVIYLFFFLSLSFLLRPFSLLAHFIRSAVRNHQHALLHGYRSSGIQTPPLTATSTIDQKCILYSIFSRKWKKKHTHRENVNSQHSTSFICILCY